MTATAAQIAQLRLMVAEPTAATYSDAALTTIIEQHPCTDAAGYYPVLASGSTNTAWTATYDLNAAAGQVWEYKAAALASGYDFTDRGQSFSRSQAFNQAMWSARYFRSRRRPDTITLQPEPKPPTRLTDEFIYYDTYTNQALKDGYVVNAAEPE